MDTVLAIFHTFAYMYSALGWISVPLISH
jgi:hypothetical protein